MPFKSKKQARAAFGGFLGPEMKAKAQEFADATPGGVKSLPQRAPSAKAKPRKVRLVRKKKPASID